MPAQTLTVEAIFENGLLRPMQALPLQPNQRVRLVLEWGDAAKEWPSDTAAIYQEIAEEDRRLAAAMFPTVRETWPASEEQPLESMRCERAGG